MSTNIMDKLRDKLSPSKNSRTPFMKNLSGSQCLINNSARSFHSVPTDYQKNLFSSVDRVENSVSSNLDAVKMNMHNLDMFSKWVRAVPESHSLPTSDSIHRPGENPASILDNLRSSLHQCTKILEPYLGIFKPIAQRNFQHPKEAPKDTLAFDLARTITKMSHQLQNEKNPESGSNLYYPSGICTLDICTVSDMLQTVLIDTLVPPSMGNTEKKPEDSESTTFEVERDCKSSKQSDVHHVLKNQISDNEMCGEIIVKNNIDPNSTAITKVTANAVSADQINCSKRPLTTNIQPKETNSSQAHSKKVDTILNSVNNKMTGQTITGSSPQLIHSMSDSALLNKQMMDRKSKQISRRSKNRKRRERKKNGTSSVNQDELHNVKQINFKQEQKVLKNMEDPPSPKVSKPSKDSNCDIFCDFLDLSSKDNGVKIGVSSFFISVDSTDDEDSDWDSCERNWSDAEFPDIEFTGLFVANFTNSASVAVEISSSPPSAEMHKFRCLLRTVNKNWKDSMKDVDGSPKVPTKVSFAPEDATEVCPVEVYDRKGEWEVYARERCRFQRRIADLDAIISPCLGPQHRARVYQRIQGAPH